VNRSCPLRYTPGNLQVAGFFTLTCRTCCLLASDDFSAHSSYIYVTVAVSSMKCLGSEQAQTTSLLHPVRYCGRNRAKPRRYASQRCVRFHSFGNLCSPPPFYSKKVSVMQRQAALTGLTLDLTMVLPCTAKLLCSLLHNVVSFANLNNIVRHVDCRLVVVMA
jgi:hypothetical protein